jgi:hypothetical protein
MGTPYFKISPGTETQSLMNAKCRVQNAKVKMKGCEIMAGGHTEILQFAF